MNGAAEREPKQKSAIETLFHWFSWVQCCTAVYSTLLASHTHNYCTSCGAHGKVREKIASLGVTV